LLFHVVAVGAAASETRSRLTDLLVRLAPLLSCIRCRRSVTRSKQPPAPVASTSRRRRAEPPASVDPLEAAGVGRSAQSRRRSPPRRRRLLAPLFLQLESVLLGAYELGFEAFISSSRLWSSWASFLLGPGWQRFSNQHLAALNYA